MEPGLYSQQLGAQLGPPPALQLGQASPPASKHAQRGQASPRSEPKTSQNLLHVQALERRISSLEAAVFDERWQANLGWLVAGVFGVIILALLVTRQYAPRHGYVDGYPYAHPSYAERYVGRPPRTFLR